MSSSIVKQALKEMEAARKKTAAAIKKIEEELQNPKEKSVNSAKSDKRGKHAAGHRVNLGARRSSHPRKSNRPKRKSSCVKRHMKWNSASKRCNKK